jgi:hypothetical protein
LVWKESKYHRVPISKGEYELTCNGYGKRVAMIKLTGFISHVNHWLNSCRKTLNEVFYGMTLYELELEFRKEKGNINNLFMLVVFGDLVGLPILPPHYSMRLLPYVVPQIKTWKRGVL